jgi:hypothetical protein
MKLNHKAISIALLIANAGVAASAQAGSIQNMERTRHNAADHARPEYDP